MVFTGVCGVPDKEAAVDREVKHGRCDGLLCGPLPRLDSLFFGHQNPQSASCSTGVCMYVVCVVDVLACVQMCVCSICGCLSAGVGVWV